MNAILSSTDSSVYNIHNTGPDEGINHPTMATEISDNSESASDSEGNLDTSNSEAALLLDNEMSSLLKTEPISTGVLSVATVSTRPTRRLPLVDVVVHEAKTLSVPKSTSLPIPKSYLTNNGNGHHCIIHKPSLEELESLNSFGSYIRDVVLPAANLYEIDKNHPSYTPDFYMKTKMELSEGMALIKFPEKGFGCSRASDDRTGRGPLWQADTTLGDWIIQSPIEQHVRGMAGVYEYTFVDKPQMTISEYRTRADEYKENQIGNYLNRVKEERLKKEKEVSNKTQPQQLERDKNNTECTENVITPQVCGSGIESINEEDDIDLLERQFWKRIGPTMIPALYGADQEDSLFYSDEEIDHYDPSQINAAASWSLSKLDSCLQVLPHIPGVSSPYLYVGMWGSVFCAHTEDMNLLSINYLHAGSPKVWYSVSEPDAVRFLSLAEHHFAALAGKCKEFLRHKRYLLSPAMLQKAGIRYQTAIQYPGDAVVTMPGGYHFGFNTGFNVAEATNFGVPEWIPFGKEAKVCLCRPDSVRIDMYRLTALINKFQQDQKRNRRLTFSEWRRKRDWESMIYGGSSESTNHDNESKKRKKGTATDSPGKKQKQTEQQRKNEFWVEVLRPVSVDSSAVNLKKKSKRKKSQKNSSSMNQKSSNDKGKKKENVEVWHLAKPLNKSSNRVFVNSKVLCIVPASQKLQLNLNAINSAVGCMEVTKKSQSETDEDDFGLEEQCFAGQVVEMSDDKQYVRVHLLGLPRTEDIWMDIQNPRLFIDGGQWNDSIAEQEMPHLHYWEEMDSKKRL